MIMFFLQSLYSGHFGLQCWVLVIILRVEIGSGVFPFGIKRFRLKQFRFIQSRVYFGFYQIRFGFESIQVDSGFGVKFGYTFRMYSQVSVQVFSVGFSGSVYFCQVYL